MTNRLASLLDEFKDIEDRREDLNLPLNSLVMQDDGKIKNYTYGEFDLSDASSNRLCNLFGFSNSHLDVLRKADRHDLIAEQFNHFLLNDHRIMKLRCVDDWVKGIVNKDYRKYDDYDVFTQVGDYLNENGYDYELEVLNKDDEYTRLRFMIKDSETNMGMCDEDGLDNDIVQGGFEITNSEIGAKNMGINSLIYRQVCTNGMMGLMAEESGDVFHKRGRGFNPFAQQTLLNNGLENAIEKSDNGIYLFKKTKDIAVEDPFDEIAKIGSKYNLGKTHIEGIQEEFDHEKQNNMFGVLNAITRRGRSFKSDYKNRARFETIANDILEKVA